MCRTTAGAGTTSSRLLTVVQAQQVVGTTSSMTINKNAPSTSLGWADVLADECRWDVSRDSGAGHRAPWPRRACHSSAPRSAACLHWPWYPAYPIKEQQIQAGYSSCSHWDYEASTCYQSAEQCTASSQDGTQLVGHQCVCAAPKDSEDDSHSPSVNYGDTSSDLESDVEQLSTSSAAVGQRVACSMTGYNKSASPLYHFFSSINSSTALQQASGVAGNNLYTDTTRSLVSEGLPRSGYARTSIHP